MKEIRTITLRGEALCTDAVARALGFPSYAGRNLDALYDCLTETASTVLFIVEPHAKPENARILRVIYDAAARNRGLWVFVTPEG